MVVNQEVGTKFSSCETEQPWHELKLDVSVSGDGSKALVYYIIAAVGFQFGELMIQVQPDGYSVNNMFEG